MSVGTLTNLLVKGIDTSFLPAVPCIWYMRSNAAARLNRVSAARAGCSTIGQRSEPAANAYCRYLLLALRARYHVVRFKLGDLTPQAHHQGLHYSDRRADRPGTALQRTMTRGATLNQSASVLSSDGKYVLVAAASSVRVYSSVTAEIVLSLNGHTQEVTAVVLDHANNDLVGGKPLLLLFATHKHRIDCVCGSLFLTI